MEHSAILNIGIAANMDRVVVAAQNCAEPYAAICPKRYIPHYRGVMRNPGIFTDYRCPFMKGENCHNKPQMLLYGKLG
jgi:hypothetical protein